MTNLVTFTTAGGKKIDVELVTERVNLADSNFTNSCWDLVVRVNGTYHPGCYEIIDHPEHGEVLAWREGRVMVKIPAEHSAAIHDILTRYRVERDEINRIAREADAKYEAHRAHMRKVMGY